MGLFSFINRNRLVQWQKDVMPEYSGKKVLSEKELRSITVNIAQRNMEIIRDCIRLMETTKKPDTFFYRLDDFNARTEQLIVCQKYIKMSASVADAYKQVQENTQGAIREFIDRCLNEAKLQSASAKTDKGRAGKFSKMYESFLPFTEKMDGETKLYLDSCFLPIIAKYKGEK